jgi:protein-S-isoprenylcysteine O-methyltransferase Ste14
MTQTAMPPVNASDNAGVIMRPPNLVAATFVLGFALELLWPTCLPGGRAFLVLGLPFIAGGVLLMAAAMRQFRAAGTHVETWRPTEALVTRGVYARTRNPIYLAMLAIYIGLGIEINSVWVLALAVPLFFALRYGVIAREERYLAAKFGEPYRAYCAQVRRWL